MAERHKWKERDVLVAIGLYLQPPIGKKPPSHADIMLAALVMGMSASSLSMRLGNIASLDSSTGLRHVAKLDQALWQKRQFDPKNFARDTVQAMAGIGL